MSGDGPPGFERVKRQRLRTWAGRNAALFHTEDGVDEALVIVLTGVMVNTVSAISLGDDEAASSRLADECMAVVETIRNPRTSRW
jgi:hypothetical protein